MIFIVVVLILVYTVYNGAILCPGSVLGRNTTVVSRKAASNHLNLSGRMGRSGVVEGS